MNANHLLALLVLAAPTVAQNTTFRGKVEDVAPQRLTLEQTAAIIVGINLHMRGQLIHEAFHEEGRP